MKKVGLTLALAACFVAQPVFAEQYRLAFSKAENIEIFVDHKGANWCSDALNMRAVYGGPPDQAALGKLLPKIGVLLGSQCPQASSLRWTSTDAAGKTLAKGTSTKAAGWALLSDAPPVPVVAAAPAPVAPVPVEQTPVAGTPVQPPPVVQPPAIASDSTAAVSVPAAPVAPLAAPAVAPVVAPTPTPAPAPVPAPVQSPAPAVQPDPVPAAPVLAPAPAVVQAPAPVVVPAPQAAPVAAAPTSLQIGGWQPGSRDQVLANTKRLRTLKDQNGCEIVSSFNLDEATLSYVTLQTEGLKCDANGRATGKGKIRMERSDGARLAQTGDVWLSEGLIFPHAVAPMHLAYVSPEGREAWFNLGSDGSRFQYLAHGSHWNYGSGIDGWRIDRIDILTTQPEAFRSAAEIKVAVDQALRVAEERALPLANRLSLVFSDNFEQGIVPRNTDNLLYTINAARNSNWRGEITGDWRYDLQNGQNYLFRRDEMAARRKKEELRQQAYRERDNLRQYDNLVEQAKNNKTGILNGMLRDLRYEPIWGSSYAKLMEGRGSQVRLVVHVDDRKKNEVVLDWPYEMRVADSDLKDGWYLVQGSLSVDPARRDDKGLPMSVLTLDQKVRPLACKKDGCVDLNDPLVAARMSIGLPDWTPEQARAVIEQAEQR